MMKQYIKFVGDRLLLQLVYKKIYNVSNPFDFMKSLRTGFTNPVLKTELVIIVRRVLVAEQGIKSLIYRLSFRFVL